MASLSPHDRFRHIKTRYDVIVVGGGIYGAAVAWEAASRGLGVLLMESEDFGSGTSANSLKTIHGGLRSLQRLDFLEMREYIRERRAMMRIAPHLVAPMPCVMPTYSSISKGKLFFGAGLTLYDFIALDRNMGVDKARKIPSCSIVSRDSLLEMVPDFNCAGATGGAVWTDAQAYNSERLVLAFVMSARKAGADVFNYLKKNKVIIKQGRACGVVADDRITGDEISVYSGAVIDCTGPWAARDKQFQDNCKPSSRPEQMACAVNLVVKRKLGHCALGANPTVGANADKRLLFVAPWRQGSIVGTWYYPVIADTDQWFLSESELSNCLSQINSMFPALGLVKDDITLIHHGLQPAYSRGDPDDEPILWRDTRIISSEKEGGLKGLFWVQGVKLTTARATAVAVVQKVAHYLNKNLAVSNSDHEALYGGNMSGYDDFEQRCQEQLSKYCSARIITRLARNYGTNSDFLARLCEQDPSMAETLPGTEDVIRAELYFVLENEMPVTLSDLILRRTDIGSFACPRKETIEYCSNIMAGFYDWSEAQTGANVDELLRHYPVWQRNG